MHLCCVPSLSLPLQPANQIHAPDAARDCQGWRVPCLREEPVQGKCSACCSAVCHAVPSCCTFASRALPHSAAVLCCAASLPPYLRDTPSPADARKNPLPQWRAGPAHGMCIWKGQEHSSSLLHCTGPLSPSLGKRGATGTVVKGVVFLNSLGIC